MVAFKTVKPFVVNYNKFPIYSFIAQLKKQLYGSLINLNYYGLTWKEEEVQQIEVKGIVLNENEIQRGQYGKIITE